MSHSSSIAIVGAGNLGTAIARGLVESGRYTSRDIHLTRRHCQLLEDFVKLGYPVSEDNGKAVEACDAVIVAVEPQQLDAVLDQLSGHLDPQRHTLISVVSGANIDQIQRRTGLGSQVVRAMPNTAVAIRESMTTISADDNSGPALGIARSIFETVGQVVVIDEEQMQAATVLGACGVAFFLRAVRAASQGGVEIGFHYPDALAIAAQTAKGAASLLMAEHSHPEAEIDKVTTPMGCTIAGLNQMEHQGFSSAMIRGITTSYAKVAKLYDEE
jgi:pyrroline-5-carboxylate reductase